MNLAGTAWADPDRDQHGVCNELVAQLCRRPTNRERSEGGVDGLRFPSLIDQHQNYQPGH